MSDKIARIIFEIPPLEITLEQLQKIQEQALKDLAKTKKDLNKNGK